MGFQFNKLSVLVVEDTPPMLKLVTTVLDTLGVGQIYKADDGEKGFESFCRNRPDIVITDWHMVPTNGLELVRQIRRHPRSPNKIAPVIIMTGYSALPRVSKARDEGATEFLVKPFTANDLVKRLAYVISKPRDFVEVGEYFGPDRRRHFMDEYDGSERRSDEA